MSQTLPRLRNVEAFPVEHEGERVVALRDPSGFTPAVVLLPGPLLEIVSLFDGEHRLVDVQAVVMRQHGRLVTAAEIEGIVASLDEHGFLDTPRFAERQAALEAEFRAAPTRPASHAGGSYASDPDELRRAMDGFFTTDGGPGAIDRREGTGAGGRSSARVPAPAIVRAVIAPHIDYHRGGAGYAWAYRDLAERCDADLFVVFGTCHAGLREPFALTRKPYETPLGAAPADLDFIEALVKRARHDCFASELGHRGEHSIEFQAVFLRYLFGRRRDFTIVPILASFAHEALARGRRPTDDPRVMAFLDAIAETAEAQRRRVAFVAGADLAHVGPRFGDPKPVAEAELRRIEREDRAMLEPVSAGDAEGFFSSIEADGDRRRICGFSPIYAMLHCLPGVRGTVRHYGQWPDPQAVVTHASVVY
ncbi:MAG: AmmeMemoRadiSam system protein B [Candidatus Rokubacteria bacterium]|nr:AmmeMemoRadiSam system protein B [Candidatus Rokubacteria bacterium]